MRRLILVLVLLCVSAPASAEGQLLEAQKQLNGESAKAAAAGEYDKAALLLRSSLELGELNITWLNLGRVLFKGGRCAEAKDAYQHALTAPAAPNPPVEVVQQTAAEFLAELGTACPGTLELDCPLAYEVYVNGEAAQCGGRLELAAGTHKVRARHEGWEVERTADIVGVEVTVLEVDVRAGAIVPEPEPLPEGPKFQPVEKPNYLGWGLVGAGVVLTAGGGLYRWSYQSDIDEIRDISGTPGGDRARYDALSDSIGSDDVVAVSLVSLGLVCLAAGLGVFVFDEGEEPVVGISIDGLVVRY